MSKEYPTVWEEVLKSPVFVLNVDRAKVRLKVTIERVKEAGFQNIHRIPGIDARIPENIPLLMEEWEKYGNPEFYGGSNTQYACYLGHVRIWKQMMDQEILYATIFEDDIAFHPDFKNLAPLYHAATPSHFHLLFYGGAHDASDKKSLVLRVPNFCTHAYGLTLSGAKQLYKLLLEPKKLPWIYVLDIQIKYLQHFQSSSLLWYNWNGLAHPCIWSTSTSNEWAARNCGLVFQDITLGSVIANSRLQTGDEIRFIT